MSTVRNLLLTLPAAGLAATWLAVASLAAASLAACAPIQPLPSRQPQPEPLEPAAIVTQFWERAAADDLDAAMELVAEDAVVAMVPGVWSGKGEVHSLLETLRANDAYVRVDGLTTSGPIVTGRFELWLGNRLYYLADPSTHRIEGGRIAYSGSPDFDIAEALARAPFKPTRTLDLAHDPAVPPELPTGQHPYSMTVVYSHTETLEPITETVPFLLYLPADYGKEPARRWPLLLYLHGSGERGSRLNLLTRHPLPEKLAREDDFPAIVVSPQLPTAPVYADSWRDHLEAVLALVRTLQATLPIDADRVSVTGLSLGGEGTWLMGLRDPHRFAALAPIASFYAGNMGPVPPTLFYLKDVPVWAWHGAADRAVPPVSSEIIIRALEELGGDARLTLVPDGDHEAAWRTAYADEEFLNWLIGQRRR